MISNELNRAILTLVPKFTASPIAPDTFERLMRSNTYGLVVWDGASDNTIYGDAQVNHAFRAWHDSLHIKLNAPFSLEGEIYVAKEQARLLRADNLGILIIAEVQGQAEHLAKHGAFPVNQVEFIKEYLKEVA